MQMEIKRTPLEGVRMHDFRESFLADPEWIDAQTSVDLIRGLFGVTSSEVGPVDITSRIVASVPTTETNEFRSILINKFRTGDLWEFTTDFGCSVMFQKVPHKDGVNSLRLVLKSGDTMRPMVEYTASGCTFFEPSERLTAEGEDMALKFNTDKESEVTDEPQKDNGQSGEGEVRAPTTPQTIPTQEDFHPVTSGQEAETAGDEGGITGDGSDISPRTPEPDVSLDDDENWSGFEETPAPVENKEDWPAIISPDFYILIDGDASVRESNYLLDVVRKMLAETQIENPVDLVERLSNMPLEITRDFDFTCERTGRNHITIMTKEVPSKLVDKLITNPTVINTIWGRAEERIGGMKDGEELKTHIHRVGKFVAKALRTKLVRARIEEPQYLIEFEVPRFKATIDCERYHYLRPEPAVEEVQPEVIALKEEVVAETPHEEDNHVEVTAIEQKTEEVKQIFEDRNAKPIEEVVNNERKEINDMIIVRVNCKEIVDQPDIDKMRAVIENWYGPDADKSTGKGPDDEALSGFVSDALDYECHVETIKRGAEYAVTVPVEDDESETPVQATEPVEVDEDQLAAEMMTDKNAEPVTVDPNFINIEDPAIRQQCIQILFPDVIEPSFMHLMHFLKDHHRRVGTPSFLATKETIPTETTIVYDNLTFSIVKMKDGRFWRMFIAHTDFSLQDHDWISTNNIKGRWFQLGRDIHDNNFQRNFQRGGGFRY